MSLALWYQMVGRVVRPHPSKEAARVYDICGNHTFFGNPLDLKLGKTGNLWDIFNRYGRVTTTTLDSAKPADDTIHFGKHKGKRLKDVPVDYMRWFVENASGPMKAIFSAEIERRNLYGES